MKKDLIINLWGFCDKQNRSGLASKACLTERQLQVWAKKAYICHYFSKLAEHTVRKILKNTL